MSRNKNQIAIFRSNLCPPQIVVEMNWLIILVDAEECDVQVVTWKGEVVRVTAKECGCKFGRKHQSHVGVLFIFVEIVNLAGVERDDIATQPRRGRTVFLD